MNVEQAQREVEEEILGDIQYKIEELGIQDLIYSVETQGSYAKGTDLPKNGSDIDIFIIFNTDVSQYDRERFGVEIGEFALRFYGSVVKDATSKYVEAFFPYEGYDMEVQIVPTRHLTLKQIQEKMVNGETITIGMERTPYQTNFMNEYLTPEMKEEVRKLKQFMKDNGLYDSSMKSQGFSGYATECLIYYLDTFEGVMDFFVNFKVKSILGDGEGNKDNIFSLIDPIDSNRDLISAFSPAKIGRTIKVFQHLDYHDGVPTMSRPTEMKAITLTYKTSSTDDDTLAGQVRRTQKSIVSQLGRMGFTVPREIIKITPDFEIENYAVNSDKKDGIVTISFGLLRLNIDEIYTDSGVPINIEPAIKNYMESNIDCEFVYECGKIKALKKRKFTFIIDAMRYLLGEGNSLIQKTGVTEDMVVHTDINLEEKQFEKIF